MESDSGSIPCLSVFKSIHRVAEEAIQSNRNNVLNLCPLPLPHLPPQDLNHLCPSGTLAERDLRTHPFLPEDLNLLKPP